MPDKGFDVTGLAPLPRRGLSPSDKGLIALGAFLVLGIGAFIWDWTTGSDAQQAADRGFVDPVVAQDSPGNVEDAATSSNASAWTGVADDLVPTAPGTSQTASPSTPSGTSSTPVSPAPTVASSSSSSSTTAASSSSATTTASSATSSTGLPLPTLPIPTPTLPPLPGLP